MHIFPVNWWNSNGQQNPNNASEVESPKKLYHASKPLGLQLSDDSSSQRHEISGENESLGKDVESQMKPVLLVSNPDLGYNPPMNHLSYHCADPCFGGIFPAYGPQALIQLPVNSQMTGISPARVPLPADVAQDEPIYVNAKQYNGILRRRQLRAKLEAQNKLIKNRKPYLHESRHLHALKRVRGSGGRFLSSKNVLPDIAPATSTQHAAGSTRLHLDNGNMLSSEKYHSRPAEYVTSSVAGLELSNISTNDGVFQQPDGRFSHSGGVLQCSGSQMCSGTHHSASAVQ